MRPRFRRKGKAVGRDLDRQGDQRPDVGAKGIQRRHRRANVGATSRVKMDSRWTASRLMLSPLVLRVVASQAAMDTGTRDPRLGGTGRRPAGRTSRMAGDPAVVVSHSRGSGRVPICSSSRMAG